MPGYFAIAVSGVMDFGKRLYSGTRAAVPFLNPAKLAGAGGVSLQNSKGIPFAIRHPWQIALDSTTVFCGLSSQASNLFSQHLVNELIQKPKLVQELILGARSGSAIDIPIPVQQLGSITYGPAVENDEGTASAIIRALKSLFTRLRNIASVRQLTIVGIIAPMTISLTQHSWVLPRDLAIDESFSNSFGQSSTAKMTALLQKKDIHAAKKSSDLNDEDSVTIASPVTTPLQMASSFVVLEETIEHKVKDLKIKEKAIAVQTILKQLYEESGKDEFTELNRYVLLTNQLLRAERGDIRNELAAKYEKLAEEASAKPSRLWRALSSAMIPLGAIVISVLGVVSAIPLVPAAKVSSAKSALSRKIGFFDQRLGALAQPMKELKQQMSDDEPANDAESANSY